MEISVYVGRYDLLPKECEGINGLYEMTEGKVHAEICRQLDIMEDDEYIGCYSLAQFEETFNGDNGALNGSTYFVKFFWKNQGSVLDIDR